MFSARSAHANARRFQLSLAHFPQALKSSNPKLAKAALKHAKQLWDFGAKYPGSFAQSVPEIGAVYPSSVCDPAAQSRHQSCTPACEHAVAPASGPDIEAVIYSTGSPGFQRAAEGHLKGNHLDGA